MTAQIITSLLLPISILSADPLSDYIRSVDDNTAKLKSINRQIVEHNERMDAMIEKLRKMFQDRESNTVHVYTNIITTNWWETNQYTTNINPYWFTNNAEYERKAWKAVAESNNRDHIKEMESTGLLTNTINLLVTSGKFCAVRGHTWGSHGHFTLEYEPMRLSCRECKICGLHQSQHAMDWK